MLWHTAGSPPPDYIQPGNVSVSAKNLAQGQTVGGTVQLTSFSPTDYWTLGVLFHGDGEVYTMVGTLDDPYVEFECSDGTTITFTIPAYMTNSANQGSVLIGYSGGDSGSGRLFNQTSVIISGVGAAVIHVLSDEIA
ncbi:MAG: hypothetical protein JSR60_12705 [Proteobacteria bacterium]|nr:hypothetical protein [Pseudomonadota bacterium]